MRAARQSPALGAGIAFGVGEGAGGVVAAAAQDQAEQRELLVEQVVTRC